MALWLLIENPDKTGSTIPLIPTENVIFKGPPQYNFDISLKPDKDDELYRSSKHGGQQGFALLWREGYVRKSVVAEFELNAPPNVHGNSADLLFALAVITQTMKDKKYPPLAATGCLDEKSHVGKVEGVPAKIKAALTILSAGGIIFYPKDNDGEINLPLRKTANDCKITLCPVERLDQAADRLGIKINKVYLKSPYRGLEAFHAEHRSIYFGRQAETEALTTLLLEREQKQTTGVLIIAASGTGKSSLVQAGLVPALQQGLLALQGRQVFSTVWQPSDMGETINESNLVKSLIANWQKQPELLAIKPNTIPTLKKLSSTLKQKLPANRRFVWVLNQMEELFTLDFSEALLKTFCEFLQALQKIGVWVIATLRNDFYDRYQKQPALLAMFGSTGVYDLPALDAASLRQIIEEPARLADVRFEINDKQISLIDRLLEDMAGNTEALPLLEFILQELHEARVDGVMTYDKYKQLNGLMGSIGARAETVFSALNEQARATLPRLLWMLAAKAKDDPRKQIVARAVYLKDFATNDPIHYLITAFIEQRLLIQDNEKNKTIKVRVAHEALLTHWDKAKDIIDGFISDRQLYDQLQDQMRIWHAATGKQKASRLIQAGLPLLEAEKLLKKLDRDFLLENEDVSEFIQASIAKNRHIRLLKLGATIFVFLVTLGVTFWMWQQKKETEQEAKRAKQQKELAINLINQFTYKIPEKLANIPKASPVISDILEYNIQSLEKIYELNPDDDKAQIEAVHNYILVGNVYLNELSDSTKAFEFFQKALSLVQRLTLKNNNDDEELLENYSGVLNDVGMGYLRLSKTSEALGFLEQALKSTDNAIKQHPSNGMLQLLLAMISSNIGNIYLTINQSDKALDYCQQAITILQQINLKYPNNLGVQERLSVALSNLGQVYFQRNQSDKALDFIQQALIMRQRISQKLPENIGAQFDLIKTLNNLGSIYKSINQVSKAQDFYQQALNISQIAYERDPSNGLSQQYFSGTLHNLANGFLHMNETANALKFYQQALTIRQKMVKQDPKNKQAQQDLSTNLHNLSNVYVRLNQTDKALEFYQQALTARQQMVQQDPNNSELQLEVAGSLYDIAYIYFIHNKTDIAFEYYQQALIILRKIVDQDPNNGNAQQELSMISNRLGLYYLNATRTDEALKYFQESLASLNKITQQDPNNGQVKMDTSGLLNNIGQVYYEKNLLNEALEYYQQALVIIKNISKQGPNDGELQQLLSLNLNNHGKLYLKLKRTEKALEFYQESLKILRKIIQQDPDNEEAKLSYSKTLIEFGDIYLTQNQTDMAMVFYQDALINLADAVQRNPNNSEAQQSYLVSLSRLGTLEKQRQHQAAAKALFKKALPIAEKLAENKMNHQAQVNLKSIKEALSGK